VILILKDDPVDEFKKNPQFQEIWAGIKKKFWENYRKIRGKMEKEGLI
jgi:hypothetical protein